MGNADVHAARFAGYDVVRIFVDLIVSTVEASVRRLGMVSRHMGHSGRIRILTAVTSLVLGSLSGMPICWWRCEAASPTTGEVGLTVSDDALDFGEVWEQPEFEWNVPIRNTSSRYIEIRDIQVSCGCREVKRNWLVLPPNQTQNVRLVLDLTLGSSERRKPGVRPHSVFLYAVVGSSPAASVRWTLHGKVRKVFADLPQSVDFGESCVRGMPFPMEASWVTTEVPLHSLIAECPSSMAKCRVVQSRTDATTFAVEVTPSQTLPAGPFEFSLDLVPLRSAGDRLPALPVGIFGKVVHDAYVSPQEAIFGAVPVGRTVEQEAWVRSRSGKAFDARVLTCKDTNVRVEFPVGDGPQCEHAFRVVLTDAQPGPHRIPVRFRIRQDGTEYDIESPVLYHGSPK